jgi:putative peptidoglycan lipid II flippase
MSRSGVAVRPGSYTRRVEERDRRRRLAWSTAIFSLATGLSRILGLVREIVVANYFGARGPINAFTVAFQIPNLIRALVADAAFSGAFVPVFSELLEKGERARAWRVASTLFWLMLLGLSAITAVFILLAPLIVPAMTDAYDDLAVTLSQILFPIVVLLGLFGVIVGILNSYEHFSIPALTPVAGTSRSSPASSSACPAPTRPTASSTSMPARSSSPR